MPLAKRHRLEISTNEVAVEERTVKCLLNRRNNQGRAEDANRNEKPGEGRMVAQLLKGIPWFRVALKKQIELGIEWIQPHPKCTHQDAGEHSFPAQFPARFGNEVTYFPDAPYPDKHFNKVHPESKCALGGAVL